MTASRHEHGVVSERAVAHDHESAEAFGHFEMTRQLVAIGLPAEAAERGCIPATLDRPGTADDPAETLRTIEAERMSDEYEKPSRRNRRHKRGWQRKPR